MKFTSVILTLSAVVAMVQAAPIIPVVDSLTGGLQENLKRDLDVDALVNVDLRKRDIDVDALVNVDL